MTTRDSVPDSRSSDAPWWHVFQRHPIITGVMLACTVGGVVCGAILLPEDWSLARRLLGGAVSGAGVGLLVTAFRMIG